MVELTKGGKDMLTIKVGVMPGRLQEVVVEEGAKASEIFAIAGVDYANHEIRLDGNKVDENTVITSGNLLVAMKMIKGNMPTIKVGVMPGRLQEVVYTEGDIAGDVLRSAGVDYANHEIRLDGNKIDANTQLTSGNLLVAMKMIKGNVEKYVTDCTKEEVKILTGFELDTEINKSDVLLVDGIAIIKDMMIEEDIFDYIYELENVEEIETVELPEVSKEEVETVELPEVSEEKVVEACDCLKAKELIKMELENTEWWINHYLQEISDLETKLEKHKEISRTLTRILDELNK